MTLGVWPVYGCPVSGGQVSEIGHLKKNYIALIYNRLIFRHGFGTYRVVLHNSYLSMDREIPKDVLRRERRRVIIKWSAIALAVIVAIGVLLSMMRRSVNEADLTFSTVDTGTIETSVNASGRVVPAFEEIINSPIATKIVEVYSTEGDSVAAGTPLLLLDLQSAQTEVDKLNDERRRMAYSLEQQRLANHTYLSSLEMQLKVKEMDVNRKRVEVINERRLDSIGSGTGEKVREAELAYRTGVLELEQLRQQLVNDRQVKDAELRMKQIDIDIFEKNYAEKIRTLDDARIRAPRAATLTFINNNIGQQIGQGRESGRHLRPQPLQDRRRDRRLLR